MNEYETIPAQERLRLVVDALARQDAAEATRLYETCPDDSMECLDAALDKVVGFLVLNLLMADRQLMKDQECVAAVGQSVANLLAATESFCTEIGVPLTQLKTISLQLGELIDSLSPLTVTLQPNPERVREILEVLRGCWETPDYLK